MDAREIAVNKKISLIIQDVCNLEEMENPEPIVVAIALEKYGKEVWKYVKNLTENQKKDIIGWGNTYIIEYFDNPSEELQMFAIRKHSSALLKIKEPTDLAKKTAIEEDYYMLDFIENPSDELKLYAVNKDARAIKYIENPSYELMRTAIDKRPSVIKEIKNASDEIKLYAIRNDPDAIKYIEEQKENLFREAIKIKPSIIRYMHNPPSDLIALASSIDSKCFWYEGRYNDGEEWRTYGGWRDKYIDVKGYLKWSNRDNCWHIDENCYVVEFRGSWDLQHHINKDYTSKHNIDNVKNENSNTKLNAKTFTESNMDKENIVIKIIKLFGIFFD